MGGNGISIKTLTVEFDDLSLYTTRNPVISTPRMSYEEFKRLYYSFLRKIYSPSRVGRRVLSRSGNLVTKAHNLLNLMVHWYGLR